MGKKKKQTLKWSILLPGYQMTQNSLRILELEGDICETNQV